MNIQVINGKAPDGINCLTPNGEVAEDGNWEGELVDECYDSEDERWSQCLTSFCTNEHRQVYIIQPIESDKQQKDTNVPLLAKPGEAVGESQIDPNKIYLVVNAISAEIHGMYHNKEQADAFLKAYNTLGSYVTVTLQEHIDSLMTWFNKGLEDLY